LRSAFRRWPAVAAATALASIVAGCRGSGVRPPDPAAFATKVKVVVAQPRTVEDASEYVATIKSRSSVTLQPQVEGQITRIFVKSGDHVTAGAPILQIDPLKQSATVSSQEATRKAKQATLEWTRSQLERVKGLAAQSVMSKADLDQAQTAYDAAQADLSSLDAQVKEQEVQLKYYGVIAPTAGIIGDVPVHVGDRVTTSTLLTTVDQRTGLEAYINVPVERASQVRLGTPVEIIDGSGKVLAESRVTFISPQVDNTTQSVLIKAGLERPQGDARSSQFVRARVIWKTEPGLLIPVTAVSRVSGQYFAFVTEPKDKGLVARQRPVRLGPILGNDYVVLDGIKPGDRLIVSGAQNLVDGMPVVES
jgi:RND family efflux transporter MFP subunit